MNPTPSRYSATPMSRFQFLMLRAVEGGASLSEAFDSALRWGGRHPDRNLFEHRPYPGWEAGRDDGDDVDNGDDGDDGDDEDLKHKDHQDHLDDEAADLEPEAVDAPWTSPVDPS